jgi:hypothetical protein
VRRVALSQANMWSSLAVEVFIKEERIPPDPSFWKRNWRSSSAIATLVVPLDVVVYDPRARLCAQQSVSAHGFPLNRGVSMTAS